MGDVAPASLTLFMSIYRARYANRDYQLNLLNYFSMLKKYRQYGRI